MAEFKPISTETERAAQEIVDAALKVHKVLGPGLLESVYEICLCREFENRNIPFKSQMVVPVTYNGTKIDTGLRLDLLVDEKVVVEIKAVEKMNPFYDAQLLTYLKLTGLRLGLLINFNVPLLKNGVKRVIL